MNVCVMCSLGCLFHIHVFPWGPVGRLLWGEHEGEKDRGEREAWKCCSDVRTVLPVRHLREAVTGDTPARRRVKRLDVSGRKGAKRRSKGKGSGETGQICWKSRLHFLLTDPGKMSQPIARTRVMWKCGVLGKMVVVDAASSIRRRRWRRVVQPRRGRLRPQPVQGLRKS